MHLPLSLILILLSIATPLLTSDACYPQPYHDLAIILDFSGSICFSDRNFVVGVDSSCNNFKDYLGFVGSIVQSLDVSANKTRVALVTFDSSARIAWKLNRFFDKSSLLKAISSLNYTGGGGTSTGTALQLTRTEIFGKDGDRPKNPNTILLITDGCPTLALNLVPIEMELLEKDGVVVYAIGVTDQVDRSQLRALSTYPQKENENYFLSPYFSSLVSTKNDFLKISNLTCPAYLLNLQKAAPRLLTFKSCAPDLVIVLDASGSICDSDPNYSYLRGDLTCDNFRNYVRFVHDLVSALTIGPNDVMVGLIVYGSSVVLKWNLDRYPYKADLLAAINNLNYMGGDTYTAGALQIMRTQLYGSAANRPGHPDIAIFITDGKPTIDIADLQTQIDLANQANIRIFAVGVTNSIDETILKDIAVPGHTRDQNYFFSADFSTMSKIQNLILESNEFCSDIGSMSTLLPPVPANQRQLNPCNSFDLAIGLDISGSICDSDPNYEYGRDTTCSLYQNAVDFIYNFVNGLTIGPDDVKVGGVTFGERGNLIWNLDKYTNKASLMPAIQAFHFEGGHTYISDGLRVIRNQVFGTPGDRPDRPNYALVLTDGFPTVDPSSLANEVAANERAGITTFTVGITALINQDNLRLISSQPRQLNVNYYLSPNNAVLSSLRNAFLELCNPSNSTTSTSTTSTSNTLLSSPSTSNTLLSSPSTSNTLLSSPSTSNTISNAPVTPGSVTPGSVTPGSVTPGSVTPESVTPGSSSTASSAIISMSTISNTPTNIPQNNCNKTISLVLLVDDSSSIEANTFMSHLSFLHQLLRIYSIQTASVAMVTFNQVPMLRWNFQKFTNDYQALDTSFQQINYTGGDTNTARALTYARNLLLGQPERRVAILVTDSESVGSVRRLKEEVAKWTGMELYAVASVLPEDEAEFSLLSSPPQQKNTNYFTDFGESTMKALQRITCLF